MSWSSGTSGAVSTHEADTSSVHGITDTSQIALKNAANTFTLGQTFSGFNTGLGIAQYVRRTSDASAITANTTLASDNTLLFTVGANEIYWVEGYLMFNAANTTMDCKIGWAYPVGLTMKWGGTGRATDIAGWSATGSANTPVVLLTQTGVLQQGSANGDFGVAIRAYVTNGSTAGSLNIQFAQDTSDAGALTPRAGSFLRYIKLA